MNQSLLSYWEDVILVEIKGKNIDRFLSIVYQAKIPILDLKKINRKQVQLKILGKDYERLLKIKTINEVYIVRTYGKLKLKLLIKKNKVLLFSLLIGYLLLLFLTNLIFKIEVIHEQKEIRDLIYTELSNNNIKKLRFKPKLEKLDAIEALILEKHKTKIEWLEIIESGTKYIVKVEARRIIETKREYIYQDVIAAKDAVLKTITAEQGVIVKKQNDYVKKGDIVISGLIKHNEKIMDIIAAKGKIWGEVWYNVKVELPLKRTEIKKTGLKKMLFCLKILNFRIPLIDFKPYQQKQIEEQIIIKNKLIPLMLVREQHYQIEKTDYIYNEAEALVVAERLAQEKIKNQLVVGEQIILSRPLKYYLKDEILYLEVFFKLYEEITAFQEINLQNEE